MKKIIPFILIIFTLNIQLLAEKITIFAAADLRFALNEVKTEFLKANPKDELEMIYGSSGKGMHQMENGAPYDIYFSANKEFVEKLYEEKHITTKPKLYAIGRVVIWSKHKNFDAKKGLNVLKEPWVKKIAIANPIHAPYGEKAKQALESIGIYEEVMSKLVLGENISHTAQFVESGAADAGIIALSLALAPTIANGTNPSYYLIDEKLHKPLMQGYGITKVGSTKPLSQKFYDYFDSNKAKEILKQYGFEVPADFKFEGK